MKRCFVLFDGSTISDSVLCKIVYRFLILNLIFCSKTPVCLFVTFIGDLSHCKIRNKNLWLIFLLKWREWLLDSVSQFDQFHECLLISPGVIAKDTKCEKLEFHLDNLGILRHLSFMCNKYL